MRKRVAMTCTAFSVLWFTVTLSLQPAGKRHTHQPDDTYATFHDFRIEFCHKCPAWRFRPLDTSRPCSEWRSCRYSPSLAEPAKSDQASEQLSDRD